MKRIWEYIATYCITVYTCTMLLVLCACIPLSSIRNNLEKSAEYLNRHSTHFMHYMVEGVESSIVDEVADANLLNIAYYYDAKQPLESALASRWYEIEGEKNETFLKVAKGEYEKPNSQYLRYWHGSLVFVRPMLMFWDIQQIYFFHAVVIIGLLAYLLTILFSNRLYIEGVALLIAMISVSLWTVPMCLEFTWMFLVMLVVSILAVKRSLKKKYVSFERFFFLTGMITIFLDFFTTETITLLIPLLLVVSIRIRQEKKQNWPFAIKCGCLWLCGYISMWASKWLLASLILRVNAFDYLKINVDLHMAIEPGMSMYDFMKDGLWRNVRCLFPISYIHGSVALWLAIIIGLVVLCLILNKKDRKTVCLFLLLAFIPYSRFAIIRHHSWLHYFFTYRAQAASVMALCLAFVSSRLNNSRKYFKG